MTIQQELKAELTDAMRAGDKRRRDVIRQIESEVGIVKTAPGFEGEVNDDVYEVVIGAYRKKMQKALDEYRSLGEGGSDLASQLEFEIKYLERWAGTTRSATETRALVERTIADLGVAGDPKAVGRVIGTIMKAFDGVDGRLVNQLVREALGA